MVDLGEDEERFYNFMLPLTSMLKLVFKLLRLALLWGPIKVL